MTVSPTMHKFLTIPQYVKLVEFDDWFDRLGTAIDEHRRGIVHFLPMGPLWGNAEPTDDVICDELNDPIRRFL